MAFIKVDLDKLIEEAGALPSEIAAREDVHESDRGFYEPTEAGGFALHEGRRDQFVRELTQMAHEAKLRAENERLKEDAKRARVIAVVRESMSKAGVSPKLMEGALALFL